MKTKFYKLTISTSSEIILEKFDFFGKITSKITKQHHKFSKVIYLYTNEDKISRITDSDGYEEIYEYDKNNNLIEKRDNLDRFEIYEYDDNSHMIYSNNSENEQFWYKYDEKGNPTYFKNHDGLERISSYEYDEFDRIIFSKTDGFSTWNRYDSDGNLIYKKHQSDKYLYEYTAEYEDNLLSYEKINESGKVLEIWHEYQFENLVYSRNSKGEHSTKEYDMNGNLILDKTFSGDTVVTIFDEFNNKTFYRGNDGVLYWNKFDKNKNIIYSNNGYGQEVWRDFNENNDVIFEDSNGKKWFKYFYYEDLNDIDVNTLLTLENFGNSVVVK